MKQQRIVHKIKADYGALSRAESQMAESCSIENVHQFRLCYKHIDALVDMLAYKRWAKDLIIPQKLKKVYKYSGTIRKLQLQVDTFRRSENKFAIQYLKVLKLAIRDAERQLLKLLSSKLVRKSRSQNMAEIKGSFRTKDYCKFLVAKSKRIYKIIHEEPMDDQKLHTIRKDLKRILYTKGLLTGRIRTGEKALHIYNSSFEGLLQNLGRLQDECNVIDLLEPQRYPKLSHEVKLWMKGQRQKLRERKEKMRKRLSAQLRRELQSDTLGNEDQSQSGQHVERAEEIPDDGKGAKV